MAEQRILLLRYMWDAVTRYTTVKVFTYTRCAMAIEQILPEEIHMTAEAIAALAELRGLAVALGDKELLALVDKGYDLEELEEGQRNFEEDVVEVAFRAQQLYARIAKLLMGIRAECTVQVEEL